MDLTLHVATPEFAKLQKLAVSSGRSVEEVASELLRQRIDEAGNAQNKEETRGAQRPLRWGYKGVPWDQIPPAERARLDREGYERFPIQADEFAIHPDDTEAFGES